MTDPASVRLEIDVETRGIKRLLERLSQLADSPSGALETVGQAIVDDMVRPAFQDLRSPDGKEWPALKKATLAARRRRGKTGTRPLFEIGELLNSFTYTITDGGTALRVGSPRRDALYHQGDDTRPRTVIPERAMLPKPTAAGNLRAGPRAIIQEALEDAIQEYLR